MLHITADGGRWGKGVQAVGGRGGLEWGKVRGSRIDQWRK